MKAEKISISVERDRLEGTFLRPPPGLPGFLFVHGWGGSQEQDLARAQEIATLSCVCLTFDLRGHAADSTNRTRVSREENLNDVVAAYDTLAADPAVDPAAIAVIGSSYGGYLSALLTSIRPVRWLGLRVPALYRNEKWDKPKAALDRSDLATYRRGVVAAADNSALSACARFTGDVLVVESEHDDLVPHAVIANYIAAFRKARSLTYRMIEGADHALEDESCRRTYNRLVVNWMYEMVLGARGGSRARLAE